MDNKVMLLSIFNNLRHILVLGLILKDIRGTYLNDVI